MSGIVGSRLNIRGSGIVGSIGTDGQVLTSSGAGQEIVFEDAGGAVTALNNATANELVTVGSTTTELDAETNLVYDGDLAVTSGNIEFATDGKGIQFTGKSRSNILDDYEEGNFTCSLSGGGGTISMAETGAHYCKVGNIVNLTGDVQMNESSSVTGNVKFTSPFTGGTGYAAGGYYMNGLIDEATEALIWSIPAGTTDVYLDGFSGTGLSALGTSVKDGVGYVAFGMTFNAA